MIRDHICAQVATCQDAEGLYTVLGPVLVCRDYDVCGECGMGAESEGETAVPHKGRV